MRRRFLSRYVHNVTRCTHKATQPCHAGRPQPKCSLYWEDWLLPSIAADPAVALPMHFPKEVEAIEFSFNEEEEEVLNRSLMNTHEVASPFMPAHAFSSAFQRQKDYQRRKSIYVGENKISLFFESSAADSPVKGKVTLWVQAQAHAVQMFGFVKVRIYSLLLCIFKTWRKRYFPQPFRYAVK